MLPQDAGLLDAVKPGETVDWITSCEYVPKLLLPPPARVVKALGAVKVAPLAEPRNTSSLSAGWVTDDCTVTAVPVPLAVQPDAQVSALSPDPSCTTSSQTV